MVIAVNDNNFEEEVLKASEPVLVDFYADWCGPCKMMSPLVEAMEASYEGKLKVCKVNVDNAQKTAGQYGVMSIPTFLFFKGGEVVHQAVGALPQNAFEEEIRRVIGG